MTLLPVRSRSVFGRRVVARLSELLVEVQAAAARFEADRWSGDDCARLSEELARAAKACTAASARAAARAVECGRGDVEWVARTAGSTPAQARESLSTTSALGACPATGEAVASGVGVVVAGPGDRARRGGGAGFRGRAVAGGEDSGDGGSARGGASNGVGVDRS